MRTCSGCEAARTTQPSDKRICARSMKRTGVAGGMVMCRMALLCWESFQQNLFLQEAFSECFRVSRGVLGAGVSMAADSRENACEAAYLSSLRAVFSLRPSERYSAASASSLLL